MNRDELRALQAPLKDKYREQPAAAEITLRAEGRLGEGVTCHVASEKAEAPAGLHPATGGDGSFRCSGDMLLEALVACAGVTLKAVATAMEIPLRGGRLIAAGKIDFRGTLGVSKDAPVGFKEITLRVELDSDADEPTLEKLLSLTERYCVIYQTLKQTPELQASLEIARS